MAYQVRRSKRIVEELELADEYGEVQQVIHVDLDPDAIAQNVSRKYVALLEAQRKLSGLRTAGTSEEDASEGMYEEIGKAYLDLMEAVFGAEDTVRIADFYEGRLMEMTKELSPFLFEVIIPKLRKAARGTRKRIAGRYGLRSV